jgi:DNA-binding transcriptional LysR family regulator
VALNLFDLTSTQQFLALDARTLDLGFVGLPNPGASQGQLSVCLALDSIVVALPAAHALVGQPELHLSDLDSDFFVGMSAKSHPGARQWLLDTCSQAGFIGKILQEADGESAAIKFVADGMGVALVPDQVIALPHDRVVFRSPLPSLHRESCIAWRAENTSPALKEYLRVVKELSPLTVVPPV